MVCSKYLGIDLLKQKEHYPDPSHQARVCKNERQQVPRKRVKVRKSYVASHSYKPWLDETDPDNVLFASINLFQGTYCAPHNLYFL